MGSIPTPSSPNEKLFSSIFINHIKIIEIIPKIIPVIPCKERL